METPCSYFKCRIFDQMKFVQFDVEFEFWRLLFILPLQSLNNLVNFKMFLKFTEHLLNFLLNSQKTKLC